MNDIKTLKSKTGLFVLLSLFFFLRSVLVIPVGCLGINTEYPISYVFSVETAINWLMFVLLSWACAVFVLRLNDRFGTIAALLGVLILSEPVFIYLMVSPVNSFVILIGLVFASVSLSATERTPNAFMFSMYMFLSAFLIPDSVFSLCALALTAFVFISEKSRKTILGAVSGCASSVFGIVVNKLLCNNSSGFKNFLSAYSFSDFLYMEKSYENIVAFLPFMILAATFLFKYTKISTKLSKKVKSENNRNSHIVFDFTNILYVLALIGYFFFGACSFSTINVILLTVVLSLIITKDVACIQIVESVCDFAKNHKILTSMILLLSYYISTQYMYNYVNGQKLIDYLMY